MTTARTLALLAVLTTCLLPLWLAAEPTHPVEPLPMQQIVPHPTDEPLVNPGMGLYLFGTLNPADVPPDAWFAKMYQHRLLPG